MQISAQEIAPLVSELNAIASSAANADALMNSVVNLLHEKLTRYNWVGFYMIDEKDSNMLVLGPFRGGMTPHTRIPLNQGICGAAASSGQTVVVDDVNKDPRYLACSLETKSEIVVPIFAKEKSSVNSTLTATSSPPSVRTIAYSANTPPSSSANSSNRIPDKTFYRAAGAR